MLMQQLLMNAAERPPAHGALTTAIAGAVPTIGPFAIRIIEDLPMTPTGTILNGGLPARIAAGVA